MRIGGIDECNRFISVTAQRVMPICYCCMALHWSGIRIIVAMSR